MGPPEMIQPLGCQLDSAVRAKALGKKVAADEIHLEGPAAVACD